MWLRSHLREEIGRDRSFPLAGLHLNFAGRQPSCWSVRDFGIEPLQLHFEKESYEQKKRVPCIFIMSFLFAFFENFAVAILSFIDSWWRISKFQHLYKTTETSCTAETVISATWQWRCRFWNAFASPAIESNGASVAQVKFRLSVISLKSCCGQSAVWKNRLPAVLRAAASAGRQAAGKKLQLWEENNPELVSKPSCSRRCRHVLREDWKLLPVT